MPEFTTPFQVEFVGHQNWGISLNGIESEILLAEFYYMRLYQQ
ncbi:hypothetical protein Phep_2004 [Pedobacter heparinus DSM 2366]|uniref:Uncharacterized protein n=1 Tax=Pedobacter heparinus (strain ATCC 13125 / DSM 2366 / CIP 104194 / JCM 7457 / NBRC 12017 / NCIMB 9290 / NRRL B-14731 / HIM 762-3) TaxID=485917 RepID=C6XWR6_PEDHD|nr:hypothetical protein Phep_2004 [Pedobacter heparinus DSM 2366]